MKTIYLVRHGESTTNASGVFHGADAELTRKGREQAHQVAKRFVHIPIEVILSSEYIRARDTAQIISETLHKKMEILPELHERRMPSFMLGRTKEDPLRSAYMKHYRESLIANVRDFRHSDEETFEDLLERARAVKKHIEARREEHILAVTHGTYLRFLHAYFIFGEELTPREFSAILFSHTSLNTGITIYQVHADASDRSQRSDWKLKTWMDVAHLGE